MTDPLQEPLDLDPLLLDLIDILAKLLAQWVGKRRNDMIHKRTLKFVVQPPDLGECPKDGVGLGRRQDACEAIQTLLEGPFPALFIQRVWSKFSHLPSQCWVA